MGGLPPNQSLFTYRNCQAAKPLESAGFNLEHLLLRLRVVGISLGIREWVLVQPGSLATRSVLREVRWHRRRGVRSGSW